jgi:pyruvate dehydrogenase E1 component subunit alpha
VSTVAASVVVGSELLAEVPDETTLRRLHARMRLLREFDERCAIAHRQGRVGPAPRIFGHEAMQVGAFDVLDDEDWVFPSYREMPIAVFRGMPLWTAYAQWRGHPAGWWNPRDYRVASTSVAIGTHVPHAVGMAWGQRLRGPGSCTLAYFGDGATSEGSWHEGLTFAGVLRAPVVLLCNNNGWAISTPIERQSAAARLVDKAVGYGIAGVRVDGTDVLAVRAAAAQAAQRARSGGGPTLIEAVSYRILAHGTADNDRRYRTSRRSDEAREHECLTRYEAWLLANGTISQAELAEVAEEARAQARAALALAEALPAATPTAAFETTYARRPAELDAEPLEAGT